MNAQIKEKLVTALRSGKYEQTSGTLRDGCSFCCLGVLCDISGAGQWEDRDVYVDRPLLKQYRMPDGNYSVQYLPSALKTQTGLTDEVLDHLMDMNDSGKPFTVIADYIEANL